MDLVANSGVAAAAGVSLITFAGLLWRYLLRPLIHQARQVVSWVREVNEVVMYELRPNGGESVRDVVHDTKATLEDHIADASVHHLEQHRDVTERD